MFQVKKLEFEFRKQGENIKQIGIYILRIKVSINI